MTIIYSSIRTFKYHVLKRCIDFQMLIKSCLNKAVHWYQTNNILVLQKCVWILLPKEDNPSKKQKCYDF